MKNSKINPKKIPATQADVKRAEERGLLFGLRMAKALMLTVLFDKKGYSKEEMQEVWKWLISLSESVTEGRVKMNDLYMVLREEYEIDI